MIPITKVVGRRSAWSVPQFVRGGGRWASAAQSQYRSQNALVVVQVALALVLLITSGLMIRTFQNLRSVDPGFAHPENIQTVRPVMSPTVIGEPDRLVRTQAQILERLAAIPELHRRHTPIPCRWIAGSRSLYTRRVRHTQAANFRQPALSK